MCITPESLALERSGRTVPFHNFIVEYKKNSNTIYYFVEGKDDPHFYNRAIDYEIPVDWNKKYYIACGRDKVLDLHSRLAGTINKHQVLFFIDRDLSELLDEELPQFDNLYITDDYSIENSICNNRTLENVLNEVFSFHNAQSADWDKIFSLYNETYEKFLMIIIPIMAYILFLRKNEKALNAKLNLKNFSIKDLFEINDIQPIKRISVWKNFQNLKKKTNIFVVNLFHTFLPVSVKKSISSAIILSVIQILTPNVARLFLKRILFVLLLQDVISQKHCVIFYEKI